MDIKEEKLDEADVTEQDLNMSKDDNHSKAKDNQSEEENDYVIRVRGLPWSASKDEIMKFFSGSKLKDGVNGIHMTMSKGGRPSGNAYVEFESEDDVAAGLEKNNKHMGERYIEVFRCKKEEMKRALKRHGMMNEDGASDACVRLRGLPFGCSKEEIAQFFTGMEIVRNGITLPTDFQGRSTGEAYVQFASQEIAEKAMGKHKEKIGHRYIEIFKSSLQEIRSAVGMGPVRMRNMGSHRLNPYDRVDRPGPGSQHGIPRGRSFGGYDNGFRHGSSFGGGGGGGCGSMFESMRPPGPSSPARFPLDDFGSSERLRYFNRGRENFGGGHRVHMRGLPYRAATEDISEFFRPLKPISVRILYEPSGRSSGEADVEFVSHDDAVKAMKKDKEKIQHRYIELFLHSEPKPFRRESGGFNSMDSFGPDNDRSFGPRLERPFDRISERGLGPDSSRGFGPSTERGFSFSSDRSFTSATDRGDRMSRGFSPSGGERPFGSTSAERSFSMASERPFSSAERFGGSSDRSYNVSGERPFAAATTDRSFGASTDRSYGERSIGPSVGDVGFRNGMSSNNSPFSRSEGRYGGGSDMQRNEGSDFYSSGKMFGGDSTTYQQSMGRGMNSMIGGSNYSSF